MTTTTPTETTTPAWTFEVYDSTYRGWKTVVVEGATRAGAQIKLHSEGYQRVRNSRRVR